MTTSTIHDVESSQAPVPVHRDPCPDPLGRSWLAGAAVVSLVLSFSQSWGLIEEDTKLGVVLAPLQYIAGSLHIWNQQVFGGTAQQTGLAFPMGLFFSVTHTLHIPTWCAERVWLALLLTVGFWGVVRVAEALGIGTRSGRVLGGAAYCVAPIVVTWAQTTGDLLSVVLLPWMLLPLITGSREGSPRRAAARSGVALALMGGGNASVIFATLPVGLIWLATRTAGPRRRQLSLWWIVAIALAVFWWLVPVWLDGKYGFNYLPFTETSVATTRTASAFEALRGASYWLDYYTLKTPLLPGGWTLVSAPAAIVGTAVVVALGIAGLCRRIPERLFLICCLTFGVVVISAGYAGTMGGPFSHSVQHLLQTSLAPLRNISKFSAVVALPVALGLAWCVSVPVFRDRDGTRVPTEDSPTVSRLRLSPLTAIRAVALAAIVLAAVPFWQQNLYKPGGFTAIPGYWTQVGNWLDTHQGYANALLVPGSNVGAYSWGTPGDEPLQFLSTTSVEYRNLIPIGSQGYIQMLSAVETDLDNGIPTPGLAGYLSRGGVRYIIERNDLNWRVGGGPPPVQVHQVLTNTSGLEQVAAFGPVVGFPQVENAALPLYESPDAARLRAVEIFAVMPRSTAVASYPASNPVVVSGDAGSLLPLTGAGLVNGRASVLSGDPKASLHAAGAPDATWAITDGNQLRYTEFGSIRYNTSYLLGPGQTLGNSPPEVPKTFQVVGGLQHETVSDPAGAAAVSASSYGSSVLLAQSNEGPASAFDHNATTSWVADATNQSIGQWVAITLQHRIPMSHIVLTPLKGNRYQPLISRVTITTDTGSVTRNIPPDARSVRLAVRPGYSHYLRVTIDDVTGGVTSAGGFAVGAGITNIAIPGISFTQRMRVPDDESSAIRGATGNLPFVVFDRPIVNPNYSLGEVTSDDPEMGRIFSLPKAMTARMNGYAVAATGSQLEDLLDSLSPPPSALTVQASATSWLGDLPLFRPQNVVDSSPEPWIAGQNDGHPALTLSWGAPRSVDSISLTPSPFASIPTEISLTDSSGKAVLLQVPKTGGVLHFSPVTTTSLTLRFVRVTPQVGGTPEFRGGVRVAGGSHLRFHSRPCIAQCTCTLPPLLLAVRPGPPFEPERRFDSHGGCWHGR